jgi:hypothetical protein
VLANRPLNAFNGRRLVRLAEPERVGRYCDEIETVFKAVGSLYVSNAGQEADRLKRTVAAADSDWADAAELSRQAVRAIRSTAGISSVLVGMRQTDYVDDVLQELKHPVRVKDRTDSWHRLKRAL